MYVYVTVNTTTCVNTCPLPFTPSPTGFRCQLTTDINKLYTSVQIIPSYFVKATPTTYDYFLVALSTILFLTLRYRSCKSI